MIKPLSAPVLWGFPGGSRESNPPAKKEAQIQSLGREHFLKKQPTPVILPEKSHGQENLVGYSLWVTKESDTT